MSGQSKGSAQASTAATTSAGCSHQARGWRALALSLSAGVEIIAPRSWWQEGAAFPLRRRNSTVNLDAVVPAELFPGEGRETLNRSLTLFS
jgi:hypothetical protein